MTDVVLFVHDIQKRKKKERYNDYVLTTSNIRESLSASERWIGKQLLLDGMTFTKDSAWYFLMTSLNVL